MWFGSLYQYKGKYLSMFQDYLLLSEFLPYMSSSFIKEFLLCYVVNSLYNFCLFICLFQFQHIYLFVRMSLCQCVIFYLKFLSIASLLWTICPCLFDMSLTQQFGIAGDGESGETVCPGGMLSPVHGIILTMVGIHQGEIHSS